MKCKGDTDTLCKNVELPNCVGRTRNVCPLRLSVCFPSQHGGPLGGKVTLLFMNRVHNRHNFKGHYYHILKTNYVTVDSYDIDTDHLKHKPVMQLYTMYLPHY